MSRFWSPIVETLTPYVPGEQPRIPGLVKLNTNEHPYPPSPRVGPAIAAAAESLNLYPDPTAAALRGTIAEVYGVAPEEVFVGNGSDEVLAIAFQALLKHDAPLLFPDITYSFYPVYCGLYGIAYREIPLDAALRVQVADFTGPCGGVVLPNPNAPTGIGLSRADIETLLRAHPDAVVLIDEAYVDFGGESAVPLVRDHANLLVVQTLSKSRALAGLRVGFAIGQAHLIEALVRVKDSFNSYPLDRLALAGAAAAIADTAWLEDNRARVVATREDLASALQSLGFEVLPSVANFLFVRHPDHAGDVLAAALRERAILVRRLGHPRIADYLRITIGTPEACGRLVEALRAILHR
ncbi:histidinol-phosphate transaminase [Aquabacter spiritensis]|uniref:Histidinol-phosphate aminotransferase n=1 Tax=Aquabacter spiritensis TaxID=933073 RepID=A0A4V2UXC2_9HYPH|nr:histidinol-phosphate transaminase [Aquabacter spiritensis]TCT02958.1 histidinol-phosphate aminotransferase [Aquabacter spiritensis]